MPHPMLNPIFENRTVSLTRLSRRAALAAVAGLVLALVPLAGNEHWRGASAFAQSEEELSQPDQAPPDDADQSAQAPEESEAVQPLEPGEAVVTRFSHTKDGTDAKGNPFSLIDPEGISVSIIDVRNPAEPPIGQHWIDEPQRMFVTARDVGQVFGVAIAQRPDSDAPTIFVSATAAYGLHRLDSGWMPGMWGTDGGPGSIYRLSPENGYKPEKFADITLDGRQNTGAALGNIAYDKIHDRLFVSDLETGMIHSLDAASGEDMGTYDHGNDGRASFLDVWTQQQQALDPISFDPASAARIKECGEKFTRDPSCWNLADFRRRVWGLKVRSDQAGGVRLYYSVWGSDAFGNPDWAKSGDDRRNSVWSVAIGEDGSFDTQSVRREFFMQGFWPSMPRFGDKAGNSNPVADITFPECATQNVMLVAERGGMRNLGLSEVEPFARPYESRVLRYELGEDDIWRPKGRYDVGFHDRNGTGGEPFLFASAAGGVDFGYKFDANGVADLATASQSVWMTGDGLCSPAGPCNDTTKGVGTDPSEVHGLQGTPADGFVPADTDVQPASTEQSALFRSYMIDTDINIDEDGKPVDEELTRNDATKIGDVAIYQVCQSAEPLPAVDVPPEGDQQVVIDEPPEDWPVHTLDASHNKWASTSHRVRSSWHYRNGSWHDARRSWHWRDGSWHQRDRSWHRRNGSWHDRDRSWHFKNRSYHSKRQTWGDHFKGRSFHKKERSWDDGHRKDRSFHVKGRTWDEGHRKGRSFHNRGRSWKDDVVPVHKRRDSLHVKGRSFQTTPVHTRQRSNATNPRHAKAESRTDGVKVHNRRVSQAVNTHDKPKHALKRSRQDNVNVHSRRESRGVRNDNHAKQPQHTRRNSRGNNVNVHSRRESRGVQQNNQPQHSRRASRGGDNHQNQNINRHNRRESRGVNQGHNDGGQQRHRRKLSQQQGG
jgi:hypothetical protein